MSNEKAVMALILTVVSLLILSILSSVRDALKIYHLGGAALGAGAIVSVLPGEVAGCMRSTKAGEKIGAVLGSVIPSVGTMAGALIGANSWKAINTKPLSLFLIANEGIRVALMPVNFCVRIITMVVLSFISAMPGLFISLRLRKLAREWDLQKIEEYIKKRVRKINGVSILFSIIVVLCCLLYFRFDLSSLTWGMFIALLVAVVLSIAGPYLLLTFISYSITKEARKLTATKKDLMIKMITPILISAIFFLTFFAVFCLPLLFPRFRELCSYAPFFVFYLFLSFAISSILSRAIAPVVYNYIERVEPINEPQVREKADELLRKGNLKCRDILLVKDAKWKNANAMVSGIFKNFRFLYLTDYLINNFSADEIETIITHELGHIKHKHLEKFILFSILVFGIWAGVNLFLILYLNVHFDPWNIIVVSAILGMAISFLFNFLSRRFESQADAYAVELTKKPEIYINALRKLAQINDIPLTQSKSEEITQTHPSFEYRIKRIYEKMQKE